MERPNCEKFAKMFSTRTTTKGKAIKSIRVEEMDKMAAMKIVVKLWDETPITSSLPGWLSATETSKDFVFYYVDEVMSPALIGYDPLNQAGIDNILDQLIANSSLKELEKVARNVNWAMSAAACKAGAYCKGISAYKYIAELAKKQHSKYKSQYYPQFENDFGSPTAYFNFGNGGLRPKTRLADQHLVVRQLLPKSFNDSTRIMREIYDEYSKVQSVEIDVQSAIDDGDEGSYTPNINDIKNCLRSLKKIIANLGYEDDKVLMGLNIGASKFYKHDEKTYCLNFNEENSDGSAEISAEALDIVYSSLTTEFAFESFEDMFHMDDQKYISDLTQEVADQLVITEFDCDSIVEMFNIVEKQVCNCFHLKVGQIGSVTKSIEFVIISKFRDWSILLSSHDSCETSEPFLADFCFGLSLNLIKIGVSCITSACNVSNRVREIEVEVLEEYWRTFLPLCTGYLEILLAHYRNQFPDCCEADLLEIAKKSQFKEFGLLGHTD